MLINKECDYGIRIVRALADGERRTVKAICDIEYVPHQYAYKILKKLQKAGFVQNKLGPNGGYIRVMPLEAISVYDVVHAVDKSLILTGCLHGNTECQHNIGGTPCKIHAEFNRLQSLLITEMKSRNIIAFME